MIRYSYAITLAGMLLLSAAALRAHHGTASYDMTTEISLAGKVKRWTFENPHSWLWVDVVRDGKTEEWSIESAPPSYLRNQGWSDSTLKPGETLTALVSPLRTEPRRGILLEIKRSDGSILIVRPRGSFGRPK